NAKPYSFLDDAPLEERRTQAVITRRALDPSSAADLGALDQAAIDRVREEAWPDPRDADEMHDALLMSGFFRDGEQWAGGQVGQWAELLNQLVTSGRAGRQRINDRAFWVATERLQEIVALEQPESEDRSRAIRELVRGRMEILGPATSQL